MPELIYNGFTIPDLSIAFDKVKNQQHWKNPIDSFIKVEDKLVVETAIEFYTATQAEFKPTGNKLLHVKAKGYRNGPAGDF